MAECLFCKIVAREVDAEIVSETDDLVAFRDINPAASTHVLVVPRRHISSAAELGPEQGALLGEMFQLMADVARSEGLEGGYRIVTNVGPDAGQSVPHVHFHLIGGRRLAWPPG